MPVCLHSIDNRADMHVVSDRELTPTHTDIGPAQNQAPNRPQAWQRGVTLGSLAAEPEQGLQVGVCIGNFGFQLKPVPIGSFEPRSWRLLKDCSDMGAATCDAIFLPDKIYPASKIILIRS